MSDNNEDKLTTEVEDTTLVVPEGIDEALSAGEAEFNNALRLGNLASAETLLSHYKANNGETIFYYFRKAQLDEKNGKIKEAFATFKRIYYENPAFMLGRNDFNRVSYIYVKEPTAAIDTEIKRMQAEYYKQLDKKRVDAKDLGIDPAKIPESTPYEFWHNNGAIFNAQVKKLDTILQIDPEDIETLKILLRIYSEKRDPKQIDVLKGRLNDSLARQKELISKRSIAVLSEATRHDAVKKYNLAIDIANLGLETDPINQDLLVFKTEVLQKKGCLKDALACAIGILKINQRNSKALRLKTILENQILEDNLNVGLEFLQKAEQDSPNSPTQIAKLRSAYSLLIDVINYDQNNLTALAGIYRCNIRLGEPLKAQKVLERIRNIDENFDPYSIFKDQNKENNESEPCFVATRVFGSMHENTVFLRGFRDNFLRNYLPGRIFITLYRNVGPKMARLPEGSPVLELSRKFIAKLVIFLKSIY